MRAVHPHVPQPAGQRPADASFEARYSDAGPLGRGGMGEVRVCQDRRTDREVALKRIHSGFDDERQRARFLREARIQAQLDHPTIVPVYDIGIDAQGLEYFTMKQAMGATLADVLNGLRRGDPDTLSNYPMVARLRIFRQICQGVEYAHSRGILHRDLKPANVIVGELGETYLIDWGIAKIMEPEAPAGSVREPSEGGGLGTPGYVAPEQLVDADAVDARADVYSLGAILFELLTLQPLHPETHTVDVIRATHRGTTERRLSVRAPDVDVPDAIGRLCSEATEPEPARRLRSVAELLEPIGAYLDGDRDLALRKQLAQAHADKALAALTALDPAADPESRLRAQALREAGHALALDPDCGDAVHVVTRLMASPPETLPTEVAREFDEHERVIEHEASVSTGKVYLALLPLIGWLLLSVEVRNWFAVAAMGVPMLFATAVVVIRARTGRDTPPLMHNAYGSLLAIAATSTLGSPFAIMPGLLASYAAVSTSYVRYASEKPIRWALLCVCAALAPVGLLALDLLPVELRLEPGGHIVVRHLISRVSPATMYATLLGSTLVAVITPIVSAYRTARNLRELRARMVVQMWHLRKLTSR